MSKNVPPLLTGAERWLYRFCSTGSVSGVSGPNVSVQELLESINGLRETRADLLAALKGLLTERKSHPAPPDGAAVMVCAGCIEAEQRANAAIAKAEHPITS